jgi:hypothetical protein
MAKLVDAPDFQSGGREVKAHDSHQRPPDWPRGFESHSPHISAHAVVRLMLAVSLRNVVPETPSGDLEGFGERHDGRKRWCSGSALDLRDGCVVQPRMARKVLLGPAALGSQLLHVRGEALDRAHDL